MTGQWIVFDEYRDVVVVSIVDDNMLELASGSHLWPIGRSHWLRTPAQLRMTPEFAAELQRVLGIAHDTVAEQHDPTTD